MVHSYYECCCSCFCGLVFNDYIMYRVEFRCWVCIAVTSNIDTVFKKSFAFISTDQFMCVCVCYVTCSGDDVLWSGRASCWDANLDQVDCVVLRRLATIGWCVTDFGWLLLRHVIYTFTSLHVRHPSYSSMLWWIMRTTFAITIYYYYSARKLILILPSRGG